MTVARRVAEERDCELGDEVGYCVRFEDRSSSSRTKIKYLTGALRPPPSACPCTEHGTWHGHVLMYSCTHVLMCASATQDQVPHRCIGLRNLRLPPTEHLPWFISCSCVLLHPKGSVQEPAAQEMLLIVSCCTCCRWHTAARVLGGQHAVQVPGRAEHPMLWSRSPADIVELHAIPHRLCALQGCCLLHCPPQPHLA